MEMVGRNPDPKLVLDAFAKGWSIATTQEDILDRVVELSNGAQREVVAEINSKTKLWIVMPADGR